MSMQKGLGRGLEALFSDVSMDELPIDELKSSHNSANGLLELKIHEIDTNPDQPRKHFDQELLEELASSIKQSGVIQPLLVRKKEDRYVIIAGERRFRAARLAGLKTIPALVRDYKDDQIMEVALIENIQRANLNPVEEAAGIKLLMQQHDLTQEEVSQRLGKSRPAIANTVRLLALPEPVLELLRQGRLTAGHARCLLGAPEDKRIPLAAHIVNHGLSVRQAEELVKKGVVPGGGEIKSPAKAQRQTAPEFATVEETLQQALETKVKLSGTLDRGKIIIEFYSQEQLDQLYDFLSSTLN